MKIDLYTKIVLTVIAVALLWFGLTLNTQTVHAQIAPTHVTIVGVDMNQGAVPVDVVRK